MGMAEILTQPRYLNASRMSKLAGVCRPTFAKRVRLGQVKPSAYEGDWLLFSLDDLDRILRELGH
jgi:hypothetical protein